MEKKKIVIVGGGTAGWITAAILTKGLPKDRFELTLIESPDIATVGVGEATIPPMTLLLKYLEIDEQPFLKHLNGTYKYGIHFENWSQIGEQYMHAFGELGTPFNSYTFSDLWLKCADSLNLDSLADYIPSAVAAYAGKFHPAVAVPQGANPNHFYPLSLLFYAYQFDASKLASFLKDYATALGVNHIEDTVNKVNNKRNGDISSLTLAGGSKVNADFFVDCSGIRGRLNKQHYSCEFDNWADELPCDSAIAVQTSRDTPALPYTKSIAMNAGWRWQIPLRNRTGNGYVFSSKFISDEEAIGELKSALKGEEFITEPKVIRYQTGCLKTPWYRNSIAIGLSSGFMEPLESTSIHLIHKYALELKDALLLGNDMQKEADNFNSKFHDESLSIKDFLLAHYHVTRRSDTKFWEHCKTMSITPTLKSYLAEFKKTGEISLPENSLFPHQSWFQLLIGQGYIQDYSHFTDNSLDQQQTKQFFANVKMAIQSEVARLANHQSYLER